MKNPTQWSLSLVPEATTDEAKQGLLKYAKKFKPILFNSGFNVLYAKVTRPKDSEGLAQPGQNNSH